MNIYNKPKFQKKNSFMRALNFVKTIQSKCGFILMIVFVSFSNLVFSQAPTKDIPDFHKASDEAINELKTLLKDDKVKIEFAMQYVADMERQNIIVVSSAEFAPIKAKCDRLSPSLPIEEYTELKAYAYMVQKTYVVVTKLITFDYEIR